MLAGNGDLPILISVVRCHIASCRDEGHKGREKQGAFSRPWAAWAAMESPVNHITKPELMCPQCARVPQALHCDPSAKICSLCGRIDPTWLGPHADLPPPKVP